MLIHLLLLSLPKLLSVELMTSVLSCQKVGYIAVCLFKTIIRHIVRYWVVIVSDRQMVSHGLSSIVGTPLISLTGHG